MAFEHKGVSFLLMNAELLNSRLPQCEEQKTWLERCLRDSAGQRIFIMIHYPPFLCDTEEVDHYDNIAEPDRSWLLKLLAAHKVEAVFSGHVHNFWYNQLGDTDLYIVPSAAFPRQDYSEMYQTEPEPEGGRNDPAKLGFLTVDIHEHDHVWCLHRTFGEGLEPEETYVSRSRPEMRHPLKSDGPTLGFDLRNGWVTFHQIPPSGALDEFYRKEVRNDYPLLALCETGARILRLPINDLLDPRVRGRLGVLKRMGFEYTFYCLGMPDERIMQVLDGCRDMVSALQIIWPQGKRDELDRALDQIHSRLPDVALFISPLWSEHGRAAADGRHYHVINHGFQTHDGFAVDDFFRPKPLSSVLDGCVFVVDVDADFAAKTKAIDTEMGKVGMAAQVIARVAGPINPAEWLSDPHRTADAVAIMQLSAQLMQQTAIHSDTFVDADRGYFRRAGIVDRQFNPRAGWHVLLALRELAESHLLTLADTHPQRLGSRYAFQVETRTGQGCLVLGAGRLAALI